MGTPVPIEPPVYEPFSVYAAYVDPFQGGGPPFDCTMNPWPQFYCCVAGFAIIGWLVWECVAGFELCAFTGFSAQRLIYAHGPYSDIPHCIADQ